MSGGVHNNLALMNASNRYKINTGNRAKSSEKLASGYRINRSADDAAGLSISEKMRAQIRALNQGTENAQDGISWVQVGDGALNEVHALLHRMRELTIQSLNDTNTELDRAACQAEFDALQSEIDRISGAAEFNTQNIFAEHELPYYQCEGNVEWDQSQKHIIGTGTNDLIIQYRKSATDAPQEVSLTVPAGVYTTQELIDEIEDAAIASGLDAEGFRVEYTQYGTCNLNLEGGEAIDMLDGGLSYLFYDMYEGGSYGALVGTTVFVNEHVKLEIANGQNNELSFIIEDFAGNQTKKEIVLPDGKYTKQELIDILNTELAGTDVTATEYGTGIKLAGANSIVTGFKGNMFKMDQSGKIYHSVFYDNVKYGTIKMEPASFVGGAIKPTGSNSEEYQNFVIDSTNNQLTLQPNGAANPVTLTIPDGTYSVTDMKDKLNELFAANGLELDATEYTSGSYKGLKITSRVEGVTSAVGIDSTSSAYATLFTERVYNSILGASPEKDSRSDRDAYVRSAKAITSSFEVTSANNQFEVSVETASGTKTVTLTLDSQTYDSAEKLAEQITTKLAANSINATATASSGYIKIAANSGSGISKITVGAVSGNTGYEDIFVKKTTSYTQKTESGTTVTLDSIPTSGLNDQNNKMTVYVDGTKYDVTLPTGNPTQDEIEKVIEDTIKEETVVTDNTFSKVTNTGSSTDRNFSKTNTGTTTPNHKVYSDTGSSTEIEGAPGIYENNTPAQIKMNYALPSSMVIDDSCNSIQLTINGVEKSFTIDNGTYTANQLVSKIQSAVDSAFGTSLGGATVSMGSDNKLIFTARLNYADGTEAPGVDTSITCDTRKSDLLTKIHTTETAATIVSSTNLLSDISITDQNNTFTFTLNGQSKTVQLPSGIYHTPAAMISELNKVFDSAGLAVTASLDSGKLRLTTDDKGSDTSLKYSSSNGGTSAQALFGDLTTASPATITPDEEVQQSITIDDSSKEFVISVDGTTHTIELKQGTYDASSFVAMLNDKFVENNIGVTAELVSNKIKYTTHSTGTSAKLAMDYSTGGTSMLAIYGQTTTVKSGVDAEFDANGKLVLKGTQSGANLSVTSSTQNGLFQPEEKVTTTDPTAIAGYSSTMKSYIDGRNLTEPIAIDEYSNNLTFTYYENSVGTTVSLEVPAKADYTYDELQKVLQDEVDADLGTGKLSVTVSASGVRIEAVNTGNSYYMSGFSGDFYNKIISTCTKMTGTVKPTITNGTQTNDLAYTVGRKDIRNGTTLIRSGVNDKLSLDFTYGGTTKTLEFTLDAAEYSGTALVSEIQKKLNEALKAEGLAENLIEVGIGGVNTGVSGSNDKNALVFKLSGTVKLPAEGEYVIDGVSGSAAFSVFYQTEGELEPAYLGGTKDISEGVTIKDGENDLTFNVDGTNYTINIPTGDYTAEEIIDKMNELLTAQSIPAVAENYDNTIRLTYPSLGKHKISAASGGAKEEVFLQENGETGERKGVMIQLGPNAKNNVEIDRPLMNTSFLKINSIAITKPKYANKALRRLDDALERVSEIRSTFGSMQNRLEHAVANNENTSENTQAAESRIRDADMAEEMMNNTKYAILQQATEAMMSHAKVQAQNIIKLLQV
ncbi:MAG: flagellin [Roseburia sp.]|nr:flagellin [Roseburia sp.]